MMKIIEDRDGHTVYLSEFELEALVKSGEVAQGKNIVIVQSNSLHYSKAQLEAIDRLKRGE